MKIAKGCDEKLVFRKVDANSDIASMINRISSGSTGFKFVYLGKGYIATGFEVSRAVDEVFHNGAAIFCKGDLIDIAINVLYAEPEIDWFVLA